ncbi:hydroxymethylglutaryl-CoA lyase [Vampirovibrio sp.]|uniref:hydroxymethylglutaryl-CoA lyase n=1 Tax=Vampirovibrio sp. TaxID=2717857 RepID=UPI00359399E1
MTSVKSVKITEVGPRDGLQNEKALIGTGTKLDFIHKLADAGLKYIEVTSFVHPKAVPQLSDALEVVRGLQPRAGVHYSALVPNLKGLERALESGIREIAVFTAASNSFTQNNINMTIQESFAAFKPVVEKALQEGLWVRGYISTAFYCPFEGKIKHESVLEVCQRLLEMGVHELSIGDTIGQAVPDDVRTTMTALLKALPLEKMAMHFHDTNGLAIENVQASLDLGLSSFDSSAGGLGGCPYAPGASGNLSTDALVHYLHAQGIETGIDASKLADASASILRVLKNTDDLVSDIGNLQYLGTPDCPPIHPSA